MAKYAFGILIWILIVAATAPGQIYSWENHTNKDEVTSLEFFGGYLWATTTGGVVRIDPDDGAVETYINSDGLGSIKINFSAFAGEDEAYFGSADGMLSRMDLSSGSFSSKQLRSRDGSALSLNAADTSGDFLWVAASVGLIKYDRIRNGGEVKETYRTLGIFQSESAVNDVIIFDGKIFAGTDEGIAFADVDNEFLLEPSQWTTIELGISGVEDIKVTCFGARDGVLYVGTDQTLYAWDGATALNQVENFAAMRILDLAPGNEPSAGLYALVQAEGGRQIFRVSPFDSIVYQLPTALLAGMNSLEYAQAWYLGTEKDGVHKIVSTMAATKMSAPGPASNNLVGGGYDADGRLFVAPRDNDVSILDNGEWEHRAITGTEKLAALVDKSGSLWVATFGGGAFRILADGTVQQYANSNSPLIGVQQNHEVSVVNGVYEDPAGRIWFSLFQAAPLRMMVTFDPSDSSWTWFDAADGLISGNNQVIAAGAGTAAVGVDDQGVAFLRYGLDPENHADDQLAYFSRSRRLPSDAVTALAYDRDNVLWVGTSQGLAFFDEGIELFIPIALPTGIGSNVTAIAADTRNNIWVGTSEGLALLGAGSAEPVAFTVSNSDLVSNEIESLVYDEARQKLLIFTRGGLSILDYSPGNQGSDIGVYAYPNPYRIGSAFADLLQFQIDQRGEVRIFTVAADLVRETTVNDGWDGKNQAGEFVASGVYIWELRAEDGSHHTGKILVVRR
ncbi:MAG: two-component regulator propeller domain-containing protein [Candidatus Zixiibacteriota bacterium]